MRQTQLTHKSTHSVTAENTVFYYRFTYPAGGNDQLMTIVRHYRVTIPFRIHTACPILAEFSPILSPMLPVNHYI
jgi:hypothetical protein